MAAGAGWQSFTSHARLPEIRIDSAPRESMGVRGECHSKSAIICQPGIVGKFGTRLDDRGLVVQ